MLITKSVIVYGTPKNVSAYSKLGYDIKYHEYCEILAKDLLCNSKIKVEVACDYCGNIFTKTWGKYLLERDVLQKDACKKCCGLKNAEVWSIKCAKDKTLQEKVNVKRENTMLDKYGDSNAARIGAFQDKKRSTNIERYGCENPFQNKDIQDKQRSTMVEKYGVEYSMQNETIKRKSISTSLTHYGVPYPIMSQPVKDEAKRTSIIKYGTEYPISSDCVQRKIRESCYSKYGVYYPLQNERILRQTYTTMKDNGLNYTLTSSGQIYIANMFNLKLNFRIGGYYADMVFPNKRVVCEYDGGGHDLCVKLGELTEIQFYLRERYREQFMYDNGYKTIRIINKRDIKLSDINIKIAIDDGINFLKTTEYIVYCYDIVNNKITYR